jgi:hypothetical protein
MAEYQESNNGELHIWLINVHEFYYGY